MTTKSFLGGLAFVILLSLGICFLGDRADAVREQRQVLAQASAELGRTSTAPAGPRFREVVTLANGAKVGTEGSLSYLLDARGDTITGGYHHITVLGDGYEVKIGAETRRLDATGRILSVTNAVGDTVTYDR